jgi:hypothetical protein
MNIIFNRFELGTGRFGFTYEPIGSAFFSTQHPMISGANVPTVKHSLS